MKKWLSCFVSIMMVLCFIAPTHALSENYQILNINEGNITISQDGNYHIQGNGTQTAHWIFVNQNVNANIILDNVDIKSSIPLKIEDDSEGKVSIELVNDNQLIGTSGPGICKNGAGENIGTLTLFGSGRLVAQNTGVDGAGIGGSNVSDVSNSDVSNIIINGGTITAIAGNWGAGIGGGGGGGSAYNIIINDGNIYAIGGLEKGAGIGGGSDFYGERGEASNIIIHGGTITAIAKSNSAGIGGGHGSGNDIAITGGEVIAVGHNAPSIGGSKDSTGSLMQTIEVYGDLSKTTLANHNFANSIVYHNKEYTVKGNVSVTEDVTIKSGETLTIVDNSTLTSTGKVQLEANSKLVHNDLEVTVLSGNATLNSTGTIDKNNISVKEVYKNENGDPFKTIVTRLDGSIDTTEIQDDGFIIVTKVNKDGKLVEKIVTDTDGLSVKTENKLDGTTVVTKSDKDGKVIDITETLKDGSTVVTENKVDGSTVVTKADKNGQVTEKLATNKDGSTVKTENKSNGTTVITKSNKDGKVIEITETFKDDSSIKTEYQTNGDVVVIKKDNKGQVVEKITKHPNGSYIKDGFKPTMIEGDQSIYKEDNSLTFRSNDEIVNFLKVTINDKNLDAQYYDVVSGSIKVTLKDDYLKTLTAGSYTLGIVSTNGVATGSFTIPVKEVIEPADPITPSTSEEINDSTKQDAPITGDNMNIIGMIGLLGLSVIAIFVLVRSKKEN